MSPSLPLSGYHKLKESDKPNSNFFEAHDNGGIPSGLLGLERKAQAMASYSGHGFSIKKRSRVVNFPWALTPSLINLKRAHLLAPTVKYTYAKHICQEKKNVLKSSSRTVTWTKTVGGGRGLLTSVQKKPHLNQFQICLGLEFSSPN